MAEYLSGRPSHEALEIDMERLAEEVRRMAPMPEHNSASEQELIRRALQVTATHAHKEDTAPEPPNSSSSLPSYMQNDSPEAKLEVEYLLDIAFQKGIDEAVGMAKKTSPFVLDALHDALVKALHPLMKEKGYL